MKLFDFIKGNIDDNEQFVGILDNQSYIFRDNTVENSRLDSGKLSFDLRPQRKTQPEHHEDKIFNFLLAASNIEIKDNDVVLFNDKDYEHNTDDNFIEISGVNENFTLITGNLIGFIKQGDYSIKISSRFGDNFLKYIISDSDGFLEINNLGGENYSDGYEWLIAYLWNTKLKRAYRLGLPKVYMTIKEKTSRVRGTIDVIDYFTNQTYGKYLCSFREHSYDSPATSLFIQAYEKIEHYSFCQHTRNIYNAFLTANQGVKRSQREILETKHFSNPFYTDYNILIDLSKKIILQQGSNFNSDKDSSAFLFDISMLFEYFIRKLLKRNGLKLLDKSEKSLRIPTGVKGYMRKLEPDIIIEYNGNRFVFDVKYKSFDPTYGVKREDIFQLHTYIGQYSNDIEIKGCGFVFPISEINYESNGLISYEITQQGKKIPFHVLFLKIPSDADHDFFSIMKEQCESFINTINSKILKIYD